MIKNFEYKNVYFIGVGGISMNALCKLLFNKGYTVSGSDVHPSERTEELEKMGIKVYYKHEKSNLIGKKIDACIYSSAIKEENEEYQYCKAHNIKLIKRAELLGLLAENYKNVIAISGSHGKTTTTAMISSIFIEGKKYPTVHIGGEYPKINGNYLNGKNDYFITEACEYMDNFLYLNPKISVITNIEEDHLDYFKNIETIIKSFNQFADQTKQLVVVHEKYSRYIHKKHITYGKDKKCFAYYILKGINKNLGYDFDLYIDNEYYDSYSLKVIGEKNVENATVSILLGFVYNIDKSIIKKAISHFTGVSRRFEFIGKYNKNECFIDYAHHPTEIRNIVDTLKKTTNKNIICVFQPHTYSRTKKLFNEFYEVLKDVHNLILYKTYPAREEKIAGGDYLDLYYALKENHKLVYQAKNTDDLKKQIDHLLTQNNLILFLGAGDINDVAKEILTE